MNSDGLEDPIPRDDPELPMIKAQD
jgi:hypothetical protein